MASQIVSAVISRIVTGIVVYLIGLFLVAIALGGVVDDIGHFLVQWAWLIGVLSGLATLQSACGRDDPDAAVVV